MNIEPALEQNETQEQAVSMPVPSGGLRLAYGIYVLFTPMVAFWATELFRPEWQDGKLGSYIILLLSSVASWFFFPLLAFSIISYLLLLIDPNRYSKSLPVRLGVYSGVLLALHFSLVSAIYFLSDNAVSILLIPLWFVPWIISRLYPWARNKWGRKVVTWVLTIVIIVTVVLMIVGPSPYAPFLFLAAALTISAPFWCFLMFVQAAKWLWNTEKSLTAVSGGGVLAWLGLYAVAWRFSILKMYELYSALPPQPPPDCYIATAAAQGHPRFVGAKIVVRSNETSLQVNRQLQNLKCAELALMAMYPRLHTRLRRVYDIVGRALARRLQNPFVADLAYLCLKPVEWIACAALRMLIPEMDGVSKKMYL